MTKTMIYFGIAISFAVDIYHLSQQLSVLDLKRCIIL